MNAINKAFVDLQIIHYNTIYNFVYAKDFVYIIIEHLNKRKESKKNG